MDNTVLIDNNGSLTVGTVLYGYRCSYSDDKRIRLVTVEHPMDSAEVIVTRVLIDSEDFDGQSGTYEAFSIDDRTPIHDHLDNEINSGWLEGGRDYSVGSQHVTTLTANEILDISGSVFTTKDPDPSTVF
jgi:hypothetical protein